MSDELRHPSSGCRPLSRLRLALWLLAALALQVEHAMAAQPHGTLVQPSSTGEAKSTRQAVLKERANVVGVRHAHPGTTVGGSSTPRPRTIVTKRNLRK